MMEWLKYHLRTISIADGNQLHRILACFKKKTVNKNTILLSEGQICKELYFVQTGCIRTFNIDKDGHERTRFVAFENAMATSVASFISQQESFEFVQALEASELYAISRKEFYQLVSEIPCWETFYRKFLERAYQYQNKKIEDLVTLSAKQRYEKLMAEQPNYFQRLSNKIVASYLNITQETLSRLKSN